MSELLGTSFEVFLGLVVVLGGGAAWLTGRAAAESWRSPLQVVAAAFGLAILSRFLVFALFHGEMASLTGFLADFVVLLALGLVSWRLTHVARMIRQYPWRYRATSPFAYEEIDPAKQAR